MRVLGALLLIASLMLVMIALPHFVDMASQGSTKRIAAIAATLIFCGPLAILGLLLLCKSRTRGR